MKRIKVASLTLLSLKTELVQNKLNSANRKQLDNYFKEFTTFSTIINFIFFVNYLSYYSTPIKRKIVFKQFKGEFCKIKTIQSYHLRGSDSFFFLREIRISFEIIAVIISLSIDIYIHYETDIYPFTHSLKSVSLNKSVVYYTTHSPRLSNQLDMVDIFFIVCIACV